MPEASKLGGIGLVFKESMAGKVGDRPLSFDVSIRIADLGRFLDDPAHRADLAGAVTCPDLGGAMPIRDGGFQLFVVDTRSGNRQLRYFFRFTGAGGSTYYLSGHKDIHDDPGLDVVRDMTCLFTDVYSGEDDSAPLYGSGQLRFSLADLPALLASFQVQGASDWTQDLAARVAFASFAWGHLRDEYLDKVRLFYNTRYENLVLAGRLRTSSGATPFFLVSGVHDKGFPW